MVATGQCWAHGGIPMPGGLRGLYGIAGAAKQGTPSFNDGTYSGATVCMRQKFALLTTRAGALFVASYSARNSRSGSRVRGSRMPELRSALPALQRWPMSRGMRAALLIQGLPAAPKLNNVALPEGATTVAVGDSGSILVSRLRTARLRFNCLRMAAMQCSP